MSSDFTPEKPQDSQDGKLSPQMIGAIVAGVYVLILILINSKETKINFLFAEKKLPLWILLLLVSVFTLVGERLAAYAWRRHKKKDNKDKKD